MSKRATELGEPFWPEEEHRHEQQDNKMRGFEDSGHDSESSLRRFGERGPIQNDIVAARKPAVGIT